MKPIIFIPGVQATTLIDTNSFGFNKVWNAYDTFGTSLSNAIAKGYLDEMLQKNPLYDVREESIIRGGDVSDFPYREALNDLRADIQKSTGQMPPLFLFGYDWRLSNMENGRRLKDYVNYLKGKLGSQANEGFHFLTHSMGGLVFSCYLRALKGDYSNIAKAVLTAPPFLGSLNAFYYFLRDRGGNGSFLNQAMGRELNLRKVARTYPSLYELSPSYKNAFVLEGNNPKSLDLKDKNNWQSNIYASDDSVDPSIDPGKIFDDRLESMKEYRSRGVMDFATLPDDVKRRILVVAGFGKKTDCSVRVAPEKNGIKMFVNMTDVQQDDGDDTVPLVSSTHFKNHITTILVRPDGIFDLDKYEFHGLFLKNSSAYSLIKRYFLGINRDMEREKQKKWYASLGDDVVLASPHEVEERLA